MASMDDPSNMKETGETVLLFSCLRQWMQECRSKS